MAGRSARNDADDRRRAAGAAGALALGRTLASLLEAVSTFDVTAFVAAIGVALVTGAAACLRQARRAARSIPSMVYELGKR